MELTADNKWLPVYEAMASPVRLAIIRLLEDEEELNVKQLAERLDLSSAITTMHVKKLEKAGLVKSRKCRIDGGTHKLCSLAADRLSITLKKTMDSAPERLYHETVIPVGTYTEHEIHPTCGLATTEKVIGNFDDPRYFLSPERIHAGILWFGRGYVEYKTPNLLLSSQRPLELEVAMELCSEAPDYNEQWPSDITFSINGIRVGEWTSPGDFGARRGKFTPGWWPTGNQYGVFKSLRINREGTFLDGHRISEVTLDELKIGRKPVTFRLEVREDALRVGGLTLFGQGFGNYGRDPSLRLYYEELPQESSRGGQ